MQTMFLIVKFRGSPKVTISLRLFIKDGLLISYILHGKIYLLMQEKKEALIEPTKDVHLSVEELFLDPTKFGDYFSPEIATPDIMFQIQEHAKDVTVVNEVLDIVENNNDNIFELINSEQIDRNTAIHFFDSISKQLEDENGKRLLLYLPLEIFSDSDLSSNYPEVDESANKLKKTATAAWFALLKQADIRANYVDGDVVEADRRKEDPERIVKAVHLAPTLVVRGLLTKEEVLSEADRTKNYPILAQSFAGALDIMLDLGIITDEERNTVDVEYQTPQRSEDNDNISEARALWLANRHLDNQVIFTNNDDKPILHGKLSENLVKYSEAINEIERKIKSPQLSPNFYPAAIIGGSRLKGYGVEGSDLDVSVFARPDIDNESILLQGLEKEMTSSVGMFLLSGSGGSLAIKDLDSYDPHILNSYRVNVLFGGVWVGDTDTVRMLQTAILPKYFSDTENRSYYLKLMEGDSLRYRLLHKGFARHNEINSAIAGLPHTDEIDGKSAFYDEAYRRLATRLFFERVFLPKKIGPEELISEPDPS